MRGEHSGRREPVEYPSVSGCETYLCLKCKDRFISRVSLEEHIKEEHRKKEVPHLWIQIQVNICSEQTHTQKASTSKEGSKFWQLQDS